MCRLLGWVARNGRSLRDILREESLVSFAQLSRIHANGWGLTYVTGDSGTGDALTVRRSTTNASADPAFTAVASQVVTRAGLAHLRWASPGLPVELNSALPFRYDGYTFAQRRRLPVRTRRRAALRPVTRPVDWDNRQRALLSRRKGRMAESGDGLPAALPRVLRRITANYTPSSLNAMFVGPEALYVVNCHDASIRPVLPCPRLDAGSVDEIIETTEEEVPLLRPPLPAGR